MLRRAEQLLDDEETTSHNHASSSSHFWSVLIVGGIAVICVDACVRPVFGALMRELLGP